MKLELECPRARYLPNLYIECKDRGICGHQFYKRCKGWSVLSEGAKKCPLRKEEEDGKRI